jgi:hypothetical protein
MTTFTKWLETFVTEKGLDREERFEVQGASGVNSIPLGCIVDAMKSAPAREQNAIRDMIVRIDFRNGNVRHYFAHLAQALAI